MANDVLPAEADAFLLAPLAGSTTEHTSDLIFWLLSGLSPWMNIFMQSQSHLVTVYYIKQGIIQVLWYRSVRVSG